MTNQIRRQLAFGHAETRPFEFTLWGGTKKIKAGSPGAEAFLFALERICREFGWPTVEHHARHGHFAGYLAHLGFPVSPSAALSLNEIRELVRYTRSQMARPSDWIRTARVYEIFPRAFNLAGFRRLHRIAIDTSLEETPFFFQITEDDLHAIKAMGFDTLWLMGIFVLGEEGAKGIGSPYCVRDPFRVDSRWGGNDGLRHLMNMAHRIGLKVILDLVTNHTSHDSVLLESHPEAYFTLPVPAHRNVIPAPEGHFPYQNKAGEWSWVQMGGCLYYGKVSYWSDVAQLNILSHAATEAMSDIARYWARFGIDGFRVDMAYQNLNGEFRRIWSTTHPHLEAPATEYLAQVFAAARDVNPRIGIIAEAYGGYNELPDVGVDALYAKCHQYEWWDGMERALTARIHDAIERAAFLTQQVGAAAPAFFAGNHDEPAPQRAFGSWRHAVTALTYLLPGCLMHWAGDEVGFDAHESGDEPKNIPFDRPVAIDWEENDDWENFRRVLAAAEETTRVLGPDRRMVPMPKNASSVGYYLYSPASADAYVVVANPEGNSSIVHIGARTDRAEFLGPWAWKVLRLAKSELAGFIPCNTTEILAAAK